MTKYPAQDARRGGASLDYLRYFAAGFILLFHFGASAPVSLREMSPLFSQGWLATDFFLLLSGFVLSRAYGARLSDGKIRRTEFLLRRYMRLWPSHVIVLVGFALLVAVATLAGVAPGHAERFQPADFFAQAFLVHGWGLVHEPGWNIPTWTISALIICYALFSLYMPLLYRRSVWVLALISTVVFTLAEVVSLNMAHHAFVDLPFAWGLLRAVPLFIVGSLLERMTHTLRIEPQTFLRITAICLIGIVGLPLLPRSVVTDATVLVLLGVLLACAGAVTLRETPLSKRLGRMSYSLFLTHTVVGAVWFGVTGVLTARLNLGETAQWGLWAAGLLAALVTAYLFEMWVDGPVSRWVSQKLKGRKSSVPVSV